MLISWPIKWTRPQDRREEIVMGSATMQGQLWGAEAHDWARFQEQSALPLFGAVLDAAGVTMGTRLLDAGCGAGLAALLAALRGAEVSISDASAAQLAIARRRLPDVDVREADLEELPYADGTFDAVIAINSVFYAANPLAALRELGRVARPGARIVVTSWGRADQCEYDAVIRAMRPLMPPPPPGVPAGGPFALAEPGALESVLADAGLRVVDRGEATCPFVYPSAAVSWLGQRSSGVAQRAIAHSGESTVRAAIEEADHAHTRPDGTIRYDNVFIWVAAVRPS
jgi:SAM-dependent methyltransferase